MQRTCAKCSANIPPQQGSARPRKYCVACRPPRNRANQNVVQIPKAPQQPTSVSPLLDPVGHDDHVGQFLGTYRQQLVDADRLNTPEGAHVMLLATLFATGNHTASGAASLSRELRAAMEIALKDAPRQADKMDELSARRIQKANGA